MEKALWSATNRWYAVKCVSQIWNGRIIRTNCAVFESPSYLNATGVYFRLKHVFSLICKRLPANWNCSLVADKSAFFHPGAAEIGQRIVQNEVRSQIEETSDQKKAEKGARSLQKGGTWPVGVDGVEKWWKKNGCPISEKWSGRRLISKKSEEPKQTGPPPPLECNSILPSSYCRVNYT